MKIKASPRRLALALVGLAALVSPLVAEEKKAAEGAVKPYPLAVCIVTDNELGSMGDERSFVYEGQEIKICCRPCERKFLKSPEKYLGKLVPKDATEKKP